MARVSRSFLLLLMRDQTCSRNAMVEMFAKHQAQLVPVPQVAGQLYGRKRRRTATRLDTRVSSRSGIRPGSHTPPVAVPSNGSIQTRLLVPQSRPLRKRTGVEPLFSIRFTT